MTDKQFERFIVVRNPISTHAERAERQIAELRRLYPKSEIITLETVPGGRAKNEHILGQCAGKLGPRTLLCIAAGDGTINTFVTILLTAPEFSDEARRTPVLPLWGGNANDLAHMLNGRAPHSLKTVLSAGEVISVRPLECRLTNTEGVSQSNLAVCYASFGASAAAARQLGAAIRSDHPSHVIPGVRFVKELSNVRRVFSDPPEFDIAENGLSRTVFEYVFLNGSRFAKVGGVPLRLNEEKFHTTMASDSHLSSILLHVVRMRSRRQASHFAREKAAFTITSDIWAQFDGETVPVAAGTQVDITLAAQSVNLLATKS